MRNPSNFEVGFLALTSFMFVAAIVGGVSWAIGVRPWAALVGVLIGCALLGLCWPLGWLLKRCGSKIGTRTTTQTGPK